jgi:hypothetical protein
MVQCITQSEGSKSAPASLFQIIVGDKYISFSFEPCSLDPSYALPPLHFVKQELTLSSDPFPQPQQSWYVHRPLLNFLILTTVPLQVKEGDAIPNIDLFEDSPGNKINLSKELASGKGVVIGVPAAFSPSCSEQHIPGYIGSDKLKSAGKVFVVSVNDAFV